VSEGIEGSVMVQGGEWVAAETMAGAVRKPVGAYNV
jgi:hypothetical protein